MDPWIAGEDRYEVHMNAEGHHVKLTPILTRLFGPEFARETVDTKTYKYDWKVAAIHKLRVNIKSLTAEAKIIRKEARRAGSFYSLQLTEHRRGQLRAEARYTHLALAYFRGRPHSSVERGCRKYTDPRRLLSKIKAHLPYGNQLNLTNIQEYLHS